MDAEHQLSGWWRSALLSLLVAGIGTFFWQAGSTGSFNDLVAGFTSRYAALNVDPRVLEIRDRLQEIPDDAALAEQERFFHDQAERLSKFDRTKLSSEEKEKADLIAFLIERHTERIELEKEWARNGRVMPAHGMEGLPQRKRWYKWLVKRYTSIAISPEEVKFLGESEIARCKKEIALIGAITKDGSKITDKDELIGEFAQIDSITRSRLDLFAGTLEVPPVHAMEWPGADGNTPPGIYLPREYNPYNADVFQFNFHDRKFDRSALAWIYLHEAIPGHHLQFSVRRTLEKDLLQEQLFEPGDHEGWACYVEYHGDVLGLYDDPLQRLGKWEWDLVRSVRLVLDVGLHYEGWSREQALEYWKANIEGKDEIAEREVDRVTAMPGQVLSYKVGADRIEKMADRIMKEFPQMDRKAFHRAYLEAGTLPLDLKEDKIRRSVPR